MGSRRGRGQRGAEPHQVNRVGSRGGALGMMITVAAAAAGHICQHYVAVDSPGSGT